MAFNARCLGRGEMNWKKAEKVLYAEYARLLPGCVLRQAAPDPESRHHTQVGVL